MFRTDKGYRAEKIRADKKHIDSLTPETFVSESNSSFTKEATMPFLVREYLENLSIKKETIKQNDMQHELSHLSEVDSDIAKFIMNREFERIMLDDDFSSDHKTI